MKVYKVNTTWVDLDHVQSVRSEPYVNHGYKDSYSIAGQAFFMFRDEPQDIYLGSVQSEVFPTEIPAECKAVWAAFVEAWKARGESEIK
jgi:hypothetical protein